MKILLFEPSMFQEQRGEMLDEAMRLADEGHEVIFLYNSCCFDNICSLNMRSDTLTCSMCKIHMRNSLKLLSKKIKQVNIKEFWQPVSQVSFEYKNVFELKKLEYKGVKIGCAVLSSYINATRNLYPKIDNQSKKYFDKLINNACRLTDAIERAIEVFKPERFYFFNTRMIEWRPPYDLAMKHHIDAYCVEVRGGFGDEFVKTYYINRTPYNLKEEYNRYSALWDEVPLSLQEKERIAKSFFYNRRNAKPVGDKVYVAEQEKGKLPIDWDSSKRNIVIFNSSEDEFAAVGDEFDDYALFPTQYRGIRYILEQTKKSPNTHIYLRIHPNLRWVDYRYHTELMKFKDIYKHLTIVSASDNVSSYALMDAANTVIVFGSTIGLEAAYWGKPVILLAGSAYYFSNLCYVPQDKEELLKMINADLKPRDNSDAMKLGFDIMYRNPNGGYKYFDFNFTDFGVGRYHYHVVKYLKILGSYKLYYWYYTLVKQFYKRNRKSISMPIEEDLSIEL